MQLGQSKNVDVIRSLENFELGRSDILYSVRFVEVNLLVFAILFNAPKKNVLTNFVPVLLVDCSAFLQPLVDCVGHYGNDLAASVFFNLCIVSRSPCRTFHYHLCFYGIACIMQCIELGL